jgi:tryptophan synthase alpha chain
VSGRIGRAFLAARSERRVALIPYITAGYPDPAESDRLAGALCDEGADILELGVPFSDPLADGPVIQRSTEAALKAGTTLARVLDQARRLRARVLTPIVLMSYLNPILRYGFDRFAADAAAAGIDGLILVDLPPEEEPTLWGALRAQGLNTITLVAPSTDPLRLPTIVGRASGYLYVVARLGVTGRGGSDPAVAALLERCRELSPLPRCLGFGVHAEADLDRYRGRVEGLIAGSALLESLLAAPDARGREAAAREFVRSFRPKLAALGPA